MNIFYLDPVPSICARYHTDRHVVKMILESAQILCTVVNGLAGGQQVAPYKSTHINHPCVKWAGEDYNNFNYLFSLMLELNEEYKYRFKHTENHLAVSKILSYCINGNSLLDYAYWEMPWGKTETPPALAMPDYCKRSCPVESYRNYYNAEKRHLFKWTNRETPYWIK